MSEKLEFDLLVKNNDLEKALLKGSKSADVLGANLKEAVSILSKKPSSAAVQDSIQNLTVNSSQFKNEIGLAFGAAIRGAQQTERELNKTKQALAGNKQEASGFSNILSIAGGVLGGNVLTSALYSIKAVLVDAARESVNFKRALLEIETILPPGAQVTRKMADELDNLARAYGTTASSQAKAYYEVVSAGISDTADATSILNRANQLATGGITDTANTIDLLTTIYNVYGKEVAIAADASDSLFKTVQIGKTTIPELSQSLGEILPVAKNLGLGLDEVGANLARLTNSGFKTAEAGTLLNALFASISRNGKELGPTMNSTAVQTDGLGVVIERLAKRTNLSSDALFDLLGRQEAVKAVISLSRGGLTEYNSVLDQYSTKSGVAAAASKKILENDLGKQWDILTSSISANARAMVDSFIPAVLSVTKSVNSFFNREPSGDIANQIKETKGYIEGLNKIYADGRISLDVYTGRVENLKEKLDKLYSAFGEPLNVVTSETSNRVNALTSQINDLKLGLDGVSAIGPIEASLKIASLVEQLKIAKKEAAEVAGAGAGAGAPGGEAPASRSKQAIENEKNLQLDLAALRAQFAAEDQTFQDQLVLAKQDSTLISNELITKQIYDQKVREAEALYQGELIKNQRIKDAEEEKAANDIAKEKRDEAKIKAKNAKTIADETSAKKASLALEQQTLKTRGEYIAAFGNLASSLAADGSKAQFIIQKGTAIAGSIVATQLAAAQALAIPPAPNIALAATAKTMGAINTAAIIATSLKGFEDGGVVGSVSGATIGADNRVAKVRDGEMILNGEDQRTLFNAIKSGSLGGGNIQLIIDGREIAYAVRNQIQGGFRLA
jgi:TP901 family phage tail tape measure protein